VDHFDHSSDLLQASILSPFEFDLAKQTFHLPLVVLNSCQPLVHVLKMVVVVDQEVVAVQVVEVEEVEQPY
jgi:hypothetical protein